MPKIIINGNECDAPAGMSILQAAEMMGVEIPRFCYHDKLAVPANCRMCLVEVKGAPKPVASCAMACGDGMEVMTDTPLVHKARKGVMEMLLINHPLDCPICDQGGECDLQDQAVGYGFDRSRYRESKRAVKDKELGPLIKTVMTRCIQCTRCVRFAEDIAGVPDLGLLNRGEDVEIGTFVDKLVGTELSGNMIDICPVGALTSKPYAFAARPWELKKTESIDVMDAAGSSIRIDSRGNEVMRILPRLNEDVNEEWISDKTRFVYDGLKSRRLDRPYVRDNAGGNLREASWDEALALVAKKLVAADPARTAAMTGDLCAVEEMVALKDLMTARGVTWLSGLIDGLTLDTSCRAGYLFNSRIAGIEQADAILLIGTNPRYEATMINARIRKAWLARHQRLPIASIGVDADLTYPVQNLGDTLGDLAKWANVVQRAERPLLILGAGALQNDQGALIQGAVRAFAQENGFVREGWNGYNILHRHAAQVAALDLGLTAMKTASDKAALQFVYLLGVDGAVINHLPRDAFVVYQGHHGDRGAQRADVVLPGAAYTEKNALFINTEGRVQQARLAVHPPGQAREDWKILRALSEQVGATLPYNTHAQLRASILQRYPILADTQVLPVMPFAPFGETGAPATTPIHAPAIDYYRSNVIARASKTMAACDDAFVKNNPAFSEAA